MRAPHWVLRETVLALQERVLAEPGLRPGSGSIPRPHDLHTT